MKRVIVFILLKVAEILGFVVAVCSPYYIGLIVDYYVGGNEAP